MENGEQHLIRFHVDDVLSSHMDGKINGQFALWVQQKYGGLKSVECNCKIFYYLELRYVHRNPNSVII